MINGRNLVERKKSLEPAVTLTTLMILERYCN